jgi:hypothetical protein
MFEGVSALPSLWREDPEIVKEEFERFDPFDDQLPGDSVSERLRHLFLKVVLKNSRKEWRSPSGDAMKIIALKCLYAAMIGFNRKNLSLLYPSAEMGNTLNNLWLTKAQHTEGPSVRDRCCGHVFEKGETYYRCKCAPSSFDLLMYVDSVVLILQSSSARCASIPKTTVITP